MSLLLIALIACRSEPEAPAAAAPPVEESDPGPAPMTGLPIPAHAGFQLGPLEPPTDPMPFAPEPAAGDWRVEHLFQSNGGDAWNPVDAIVFYDKTGLPTVERHKLVPMGERMVSENAHRYERTSAGWGVVSTRAPSQEYVELATPELLVAPNGTVFQSPWAGQKVTVEVLGTQQVTVPAGAYRAVRIQRAWATPTTKTTDDAWWSADVGLVARVFRVHHAERGQTIRLTLLAKRGTTDDMDSLAPEWGLGRRAMGMP